MNFQFCQTHLKDSDRIAVLGYQGSGENLVNQIQQSNLNSRLIRHYDDQHTQLSNFNRMTWYLPLDDEITYIIIAAPPEAYRELLRPMRTWAHHLNRSLCIVLPNARETYHELESFESLAPIITVTPPCAGWGRFTPVFSHLMASLKRVKGEALTSGGQREATFLNLPGKLK